MNMLFLYFVLDPTEETLEKVERFGPDNIACPDVGLPFVDAIKTTIEYNWELVSAAPLSGYTRVLYFQRKPRMVG